MIRCSCSSSLLILWLVVHTISSPLSKCMWCYVLVQICIFWNSLLISSVSQSKDNSALPFTYWVPFSIISFCSFICDAPSFCTFSPGLVYWNEPLDTFLVDCNAEYETKHNITEHPTADHKCPFHGSAASETFLLELLDNGSVSNNLACMLATPLSLCNHTLLSSVYFWPVENWGKPTPNQSWAESKVCILRS